MEPNEVRDVFAVVDRVASCSGRVKDRTASKELDEVVESLYRLVGPVSRDLAAGVLELGRAEVGRLVDHGVLSKDGTGPRQLHGVLAVARDLRAQRDHVNAIRWWLEDRALLADEGVGRGLAEPGDEVLAPPARQQVDGLDRSNRRKFDAWLAKFDKQGVSGTDYRVTGTPQQVCVKDLDGLRVVVVAPPKAKRAVVVLVGPRPDTYDYVHVLGKSTSKAKRTKPSAGGSGTGLPRWNDALQALAGRAGDLVSAP